MAQTDRQTHTHTDGHGDSMTESAQWGRFSENATQKISSNKAVIKTKLLIEIMIIKHCYQ